jgi:hypothetical protein
MTAPGRIASLVLLLAAGCDLGAASPAPPTEDGTNIDPDTNEQLGILCNATFDTSGSFALGAPQPEDVNGCWPVGTWTFRATIDENDCDDQPALLSEYKFQVTQTIDADGESQQAFTYLTEPAAHHRVKVSSGGGGECEGGLEIFSDDGKQYWNFKPALNADLSITGFGEYSLYSEDHWN